MKVSDDRKIGIVSERDDQLVDHKSENSQLGGTSVVELNGTLGELILSGELVPAEVNVSVTEVTDELVSGSRDILHDSAFKDSNESDELDEASSWDGVRAEKSGDTVRVGCEGVTGVVNVTWKVDSGTGDDLSEESKLTDTSVLDLDVTETVETLLIDTVKLSERIEEVKRSLGTELVFEGHLGDDGGLGLGRRGEGHGGGDEGGSNDTLHD